MDRSIDLAAQLQDYALDWLSREWEYPKLLALLEKDETSPILVSSSNGSYLKLDAELKGSAIRNAHVAMVKSAILDQSV